MSETGALHRERPKLFIGIGGTGKQVLLQLRRMYLDKFGVPVLPHHGYISIDTDTQNQNIDRRDFDEFMQEVMFIGSNERVDTPIQITDVKRLYQNEDKYQNIFSWFDSKLQDFGEIKDGANQTRSFGRLAFFLHYDDIRRVLMDKITQLKTNSTINEARKAPFNVDLDIGGVDVWLVFSVAGGTGSGMFLDLSYLVRDCVPDQAPPSALILLPTAFSNDYSTKYFANSYAALMELEYYNSPVRNSPQGGETAANPGFRKWWVRDRAEYGSNPVFQNTWLVGNGSLENGGVFGPGDKTSLCGLMAEWLFVRGGGASTAVGDTIASDTGNYGNYLNEPAPFTFGKQTGTEIKQTFSRTYSVPGLSKIYVATARLAAEAEHRLASDVLDDWTKSGEIEALFGTRLDGAYATKLMYARAGDTLRGTLARETANTSIGDAVRRELAQSCAKYRDMAANAEVANQIRDWLNNSLLDDKFAKDADDPGQWGSYTRLIFEQNVRLAEQQISTALDEYIGATLQTRRQRFVHAKEGLRYYIKQFEGVAERMAKLASQSDAQARDATRAVDSMLGHLSDEKGRFTRSMIIKVAFRHIERRIIAVLGKQVAQAAERVARRAAEMIGPGRREKNATGEDIVYETGLIKDVADLEAALIGAKDRIVGRISALKSQNESPANKRLDAPGESDGSFYATEQGRPFTQEDVARVSSRILETGAVQKTTRIWDFRETLEDAGAGRFIRGLLVAVKPDLRHISSDTFDIVDQINAQFDDRPPDAAYAGFILDSIRKGSPMLEQATHETQKDQLQKPPLLAWRIARSARARAGALTRFDGFIQKSRASTTQILPGPRDTIYFMSEWVGIPLVMVPHLDQYRSRAYLPTIDGMKDTAGGIVHTALDYEKFPDLLVLADDQIRRQIDTWALFARAVAWGVVLGARPASGSGTVQWSYRDGPEWARQKIQLGSLAAAIRVLAQDGNQFSAALKKQLNARVMNASVDELADVVLIASRHMSEPPADAAGWIGANQKIVAEYSATDGVSSDSTRDRNQNVVARMSVRFQKFGKPDGGVVESPPQSGFFRLRNADDTA